MHVSPFISMNAVYDFHLSPVGRTIAVSIVEHEEGDHVLDAQLWGHRLALTNSVPQSGPARLSADDPSRRSSEPFTEKRCGCI